MGSRVEYFLVAAIAVVALISINSHVEEPKQKSAKVKNQKTSEISNFTEFEINSTNLLHTLKAKNAYEVKKKWYIKDVNITNNSIKSLTAKNSIYAQNKIVLKKDVKVVKKDGIEYTSNKAIYNTNSKVLVTPKKFTIKRAVDIVKGKNLIYNAKEKATTAKDVNGTFILKK